jgi:hypothetical protein
VSNELSNHERLYVLPARIRRLLDLAFACDSSLEMNESLSLARDVVRTLEQAAASFVGQEPAALISIEVGTTNV